MILSINKNTIDKSIMTFIIIDLLFLPYFQLIIFPISLPLIIIYFLLGGFKIINDFEFKIWFFFIITAFLSVFHGYLYSYLSIYFFENIKYSLLLVLVLFYYFFFNYSRSIIEINTINFIIKLFICYITTLCILLLINPFSLLEFITAFYGRNTTSIDQFLFDYRFTYFFQDANTLAYFMLIVLGFLFHTHKKNLQLLFLSISVLFIIILTQSTGGIISFLLITTTFIFLRIIKTSLFNKLLILVSILILSLSVFYLFIYFKNENIFLSFFYDRMFESDDRITSGGGRFRIWSQLFYMFPMPIGIGYNLYIPEINGIRSPHSDLFGMIFRYGFLSLLPLIYFFYSRFKSSYYIIIPSLVTFFINSLFDSQKMLILFLILTTVLYKNYKKTIKV